MSLQLQAAELFQRDILVFNAKVSAVLRHHETLLKNVCTECRMYVIVCKTMGLKREHDIWYGEVKPFELDEY